MTTGSDPLWVRITSDGTTVTAKCLAQASAPSDGQWGGATQYYSSSAFDMIGGMLGFACHSGVGTVDDMTLKSWNTSTSQFDVTEHVETFDIDGGGYSVNAPAHDAAGNMTFDAAAKFTYDGWNRLVGVAHAYRDGSNNVQAGQKSITMSYDGRGRRISKAVANAGQWDATYHYYYDNDSLIETRDGSNYTIKHHTWGTRYIDELVRVTSVLTVDEGGGQISYEYSDYWACQDSNYNVLGVVDSSAVLKERYEYKPYGERVVLFSPGTNDVGCYAPTQVSRRVYQSGSDQPYGICEVGHQGLVHDEEVGLVYNRARQLHPGIGRFMQRDPLEYIDALHLYLYVRNNALRYQDPTGRCYCRVGVAFDPNDPVNGWLPCVINEIRWTIEQGGCVADPTDPYCSGGCYVSHIYRCERPPPGHGFGDTFWNHVDVVDPCLCMKSIREAVFKLRPPFFLD